MWTSAVRFRTSRTNPPGGGSDVKVLQVHTRYRQAGGEDAVVAAEAALLRDAGHEVVTHLAENPTGAAEAAAALATSAWNPRRRRELADLADRHRPDVAHVHNTWYALSPSVLGALRAAGVPVVLTLHNYRTVCAAATLFRDGRPCTDCLTGSAWQAVPHRCYRGSAAQSAVAAGAIALHRTRRTWHRDVDVLLALTEFARARFIEGGLPAERIRVKANFVADDGLRAAPPSRSRTVLFVGRLAEEKGADVLLEAWGRAAPPGLELLVVGDGPQRAALERHAPPGVRLAGRLPPAEVRTLMRTSRALAFPSRWYEGLPLTILEAFSSGLPVLATDLGGQAEVVAPVGQEWLVPERAWATALRRLTDDDAVDTASTRVRGRYEQTYTPEVALRALERVYASVITASPPADHDRH